MDDSDGKPRTSALVNAHQQMLVALRHREQEIIRFLVILVPTISGYFYLLYNYFCTETCYLDNKMLLIGTLFVEFILAVGAVYTVTLGYNFRSILMQLKKFERGLGIDNYTLLQWQETLIVGPKQSCIPPEIIKVFWWAFIIAFAGVGITSITISQPSYFWASVSASLIADLILFFVPTSQYGKKLHKLRYTEFG